MRILLVLLSLLTCSLLQAQTFSFPNANYGNGFERISAKKALLIPTGSGKPDTLTGDARKQRQAALFRDTLNHILWQYDPSTNRWDSSGVGGGGGGFITGGPITSTPPPNFNPGSNISTEEFIRQAYYASQGPTAGLSGGQTIELMATGAALPFTLNWSAGRSGATNPIQSIVVAGVNQTFTTPAAGGSISGTQAVSVTRNTNTTYSTVVTTTDGKTATASTSFTFLPSRYFGWVNSQTPTDANIIAAGAELSNSNAKTWVQPAPGGAQFLVFAYPANEGNLANFFINTFPSLEAMQLTQRTLTNASGFSQTYNIYVSKNAFTVTGTTSIVTN